MSSVVTPNPANGGHLKTGQWKTARTKVVIARRKVHQQVFVCEGFGDSGEPVANWRCLSGGYGNAGKRPERRLRSEQGRVASTTRLERLLARKR
jgi:hypothetical protein